MNQKVSLCFKTPLENIEACGKAFNDKNYDEGINALAALGDWEEVYLRHLSEDGEPVYNDAYMQLVRCYFAVLPVSVTTVLIDRYDQLKAEKDAELFCRDSLELLNDVTDKMLGNLKSSHPEFTLLAAVGNEAYAHIFVRTGEMKLLGKIQSNTNEMRYMRDPVRGLQAYEIAFTSNKFSGQTSFGNADQSSEWVVVKGFKEKLEHYGAKAVTEKQRQEFQDMASRNEDVLNAFTISGFNETKQIIQAKIRKVDYETVAQINNVLESVLRPRN